MSRLSLVHLALRTLGTLIGGCIGWIVLGYLATMPLGAIYGWSGHPAIPAAPSTVYIGLYLVLLPVLCFAVAWKVTRWVESRLLPR